MAPIRAFKQDFFSKQALPDIKFPFVLTGAMAPLGFEASDGLQNLTESLFAVRLLPPSAYFVMHNQVFPVDGVRKDYKRSRFVRTEPAIQRTCLSS
jgi:L-asparaginase